MSQTTTQTETDCLHTDCDGTLTDGPAADDLPAAIVWKQCDDCGQRYEYDTSVGALRATL